MALLRRLVGSVTITTVGIAALVLGVLAAVLEHADRPGPGFGLGRFLEGFFHSNSGSLVGIGFTVLILDQLYKRREDRNKRANLIRTLASPDQVAALAALETLRTEGWLDDGSLAGATLRRSHLPGSALRGADLRGTDLAKADLAGADLASARLQGADLTGADLRGANLSGAQLEDARLDRAELAGANLTRARVGDEQLVRARSLLDAVMPDRSRYDGRFELAGDTETAQRLGFHPADTTAMSRFYAVSVDRFTAGRAAVS